MARFDWIRFDPDSTPGGGTNDVVDNFEGTTRTPAWERSAATRAPSSAAARYQIPAQPGDIYQTRNDAKNLTVRDAPTGAWTAMAKVNFEGTAQYQQAGIMVYGDDENFTKFGRIAHSASTATRREVRVHLREQRRRAQRGGRLDGNIPADFPDDF